jgi:hypothetical protein
LQTPDRGCGDSKSPRDFAGLLAGLTRPGDQQSPVDGSHTQASDVLDEELLDLLVVGELIIDDNRGDAVDAEQAARERPALAFDQDVVARAVWCTTHSDGSKDAELADRPAQLTMAVAIPLASEAILRTDTRNRDLPNLGRMMAPTPLSANFGTSHLAILGSIRSLSTRTSHMYHP